MPAAPVPAPGADPARGPVPAPATDPLPGPDAVRNARRFPGGVPVLVDPSDGVLLRAPDPADFPAVVEQCRDPDCIRWTSVPAPDGGYQVSDAEEHHRAVARRWEAGTQLSWAVEERDRPGRFCGSIALRIQENGLAEVGFVLHPAARGRRLMSASLRLVRDYAFDVAGVQVLRWRAAVGNWPSRRVAARAGFRFDGTIRRLLVHRGEPRDGWVATLTVDEPRTPAPWLDPPLLTGDGLRLRAFCDADVPRIVEACSDLRTQHWLVSLPRRYGPAEARQFLDGTRDLGATAAGLVWCVTGADDQCLGSIGLEGLGGYSRRAEIGYWSHPDARGRGLMSAAVGLVTTYAEGQGLVDSLVIRAAAGNAASQHVATAADYREVGVLRRAEPLGDGTLDDLLIYARP